MTYWNREHEQNLRRLRDMTRELETLADDTIPALMNDLREDDFDATEKSRDLLREARNTLNQAMHKIERAKEQLPTPAYPRPLTILHPTAEEVMRREG